VLQFIDSFLRQGYFTTQADRQPIVEPTPGVVPNPEVAGAGQ
jgi:hypothetical protein